MKSPFPRHSTFDPVKGCQSPWTGALGAVFILALSLNYSMFKARILAGGGPKIMHAFQGTITAFSSLNRDFYDIAFIVLLGFQFMILWEHLNYKFSRVLTLAVSLIGIWGTWRVTQHALWFFPQNTYVFLTWEWTRIEVVFALMGVGLGLIGLGSLGFAFFQGQRLTLSPWKRAFRTSFFRWLSGLFFFTLVVLMIHQHPFYLNPYYLNWRIACGYLYGTYVFLGWPYAFITNLLRGHRFENRSDPCFVLMLIWNNLLKSLLHRNLKQIRRTFYNRRILMALRDLLVKLFFVPLMIVFLYSEYGKLFNHLPGFLNTFKNHNFNPVDCFDRFYHTALEAIFVMDVALGLIGYVSSSRWLANKSKSVDGTLSGWMVAVMCYPPFNGVTSNYLPYSQWSGTPYAIFQAEWLDITLKVATLLFFLVYVWATMAFGLRFSNLTHRGIITRGPYTWIRHPAYLSKNLAWWTESLRGFSSPWQFIFLGLWNLIYGLRAVTEERHLKHDPDYLSYCEKVKYKFIPGIW
ncbi:methyltransferase [Deltaproteobacteria bacterium TL4]